MRKEDFCHVLGQVNEQYVQAARTPKKRKTSPWVKWAAAAACLCLAVGITVPLSADRHGTKDTARDIAALEFNGCYYEAVNIPKVLEKFGLPAEITADMAGEPLSYFQSDGGAGYKESPVETDIELYQYAPVPCQGVYVLRDGDTYYAALFCGFRETDSNASRAMTELYRVYGIESADDIASVVEVDWNDDKVIGEAVTDRREITQFYDLTTSLQSCGNDDFQAMTFGGIPEESQPEAHTQFADDRRNLRIETTDGLRFFLGFYSSYDWIRSSGTLSCYRIDEPTRQWIDRNLN